MSNLAIGLKTYRIVATLHSRHGVDLYSDQGIESIEVLTQRNPSQGIVELAANQQGYDPQDWDVIDWYSDEYQGKININAIHQWQSKEYQDLFFAEDEGHV